MQRILIIGCHGGVGRAVVALLGRPEFRRLVLEPGDEVLLVDRQRQQQCAVPDGAVLLPPTTIASGDDLARLVRDHRITQVIDLSPTDTVECSRVCDALGVDYLCTSVEEWPDTPPLTTAESIARLLPPLRPQLRNSAQLVGSGANPGIVNALVFAALNEFAARAGVAPTPRALDLYAVLVTEDDNTTDARPVDPDVFAMTWSPRHCLEELFEPASFVGSCGEVVPLDHEPTAATYRVRCGIDTIEGFAVPHEEIVTLAHRFPSIEQVGFVYRLPPSARTPLEAHPERRHPDAWPTRRLWPPWTNALRGRDRVGVLLCSRRFGELWMGFETDQRQALALGVNATQLQVAGGVFAGWAQLGRRRGIHFVEDLDCDPFVTTVSHVLGQPQVAYDADARPQPLRERRAAVPSLTHAVA